MERMLLVVVLAFAALQLKQRKHMLLQTAHRSIHSTMGKIVGEIVVFQQKKENIKMTLANKNYE